MLDRAVASLATTSAAASAAREIEKFAGAYKDQAEELTPMLQVVAQHHAPALLDLLEKSRARETRVLLLDVLPAAGAALLPLVRERLRSPDWFVVRNMVILMRRMAVQSVELLPVVQHAHAAVRFEVLRALRGAAPGDDRVVGLLIDYLSDEDPDIRSGALLTLGDAQLTERDIARLESVATEEKRTDDTRKSAIRALGRSASSSAARALFRLLEPKGMIELPSTTALRDRVAIALRDSRAPDARALFETGLQSSSRRVRRACERAREGHDA
jgi:HEAT repeat protein